MVRVVEVSRTYREQEGTQVEIIAKLEAQGWVDSGGRDVWGNAELMHKDLPGQRRIVYKR